MARRLFNLRHVPNDEADEIRTLLREHEIDFHETASGFLDLMSAAIWVTDESRYTDARELLDHYQQQRYQRARQDYLARKAQNQVPGFGDRLRSQPLTMLLYLLLAVCLLALTTLPFWL